MNNSFKHWIFTSIAGYLFSLLVWACITYVVGVRFEPVAENLIFFAVLTGFVHSIVYGRYKASYIEQIKTEKKVF